MKEEEKKLNLTEEEAQELAETGSTGRALTKEELENLPKKAKEKPTTQVTSLAQEEQAAGKKIEMPSPEELVQRASTSLLQKLAQLEAVFMKLSSRGKTRVMLAILNLPMDGVPVHLQSEAEKVAFALGQRVIGDRFVIIQHHINMQIQEQKALEAALDNAEKEKKEAEEPAEEKSEESKEKENE